jgi:hypothetical protein
MHKYRLVIEASRDRPADSVEMRAVSVTSAFSWAERCAHGRRFEIFEDERSLGRATLERANFWILAPASGNSPRAPRSAKDCWQSRQRTDASRGPSGCMYRGSNDASLARSAGCSMITVLP